MKVKQAIELLQKCDPETLVGFWARVEDDPEITLLHTLSRVEELIVDSEDLGPGFCPRADRHKVVILA